MLLLLMMYLSPLIAVALYWRAQSAMAAALGASRALAPLSAAELGEGDLGTGGASSADEDASAWSLLRSVVETRLPLAAPVAAISVTATAIVALSTGLSGAIAFSGGLLLSALASAIVHSALLATLREPDSVLQHDASLQRRRIWGDSIALAQTLAALTAGSVGVSPGSSPIRPEPPCSSSSPAVRPWPLSSCA